MKYLKACRNCLKGKPIFLTGDVLCKYKGVVSADFVCIRHKLIPELKTYKEMDYKCIDCANFSIKYDSYGQAQASSSGSSIRSSAETSIGSSVGLCKIFSVRPFDGTKKCACSKFMMRPEVRVKQFKVKNPIRVVQINNKSGYLQY